MEWYYGARAAEFLYGSTAPDSDLTIVTAFWDIGSFQKGPDESRIFSKELYMEWLRAFKFMNNPLVIFTDSYDFLKTSMTYRYQFSNKTRIFYVNRRRLWPFRLTEHIRAVYSQEGYPKHHPNTVVPEYAAAQHAKYAVLAYAAKQRYFSTPYYAWLDIGYFRDIAKNEKYFSLHHPPKFDSSKIAFNRVYDVTMEEIPHDIFKDNKVWVGGGFALGIPDVILKFEEMYRRAVVFFLDKNLMNTDQQVLYSIFSTTGRLLLEPPVELQLYYSIGRSDMWFHLGYLCMGIEEYSNYTE